MTLSGKKILIISPERWGVNMLSKHHYAIALAKRGNAVYFLNPPSKEGREVELVPTEVNGLIVINYSQSLKGLNRLHRFPKLLSILSSIDVRKIMKKISTPIDVVWSFDPFRFQHLRLFRAPLNIFHPVDFFKSDIDLLPAREADIIFSVAKPIVDRFQSLNVPSFFVNHGVSQTFIDQQEGFKKLDSPIRCGYLGNLLSFAMHWQNLLQIVSESPNVEFHFIGPYSKNNLGEAANDDDRIASLKAHKNVVLHGEMHPDNVAKKLQDFDIFLICYDPEKFGHVVSNSHKVLEYLSTGMVVVSSRMSSYDQLANGLFEMVTDSVALPQKFKEVVENISVYNSEEFQKKRKAFAQANSYESHLKKIEQLITENASIE